MKYKALRHEHVCSLFIFSIDWNHSNFNLSYNFVSDASDVRMFEGTHLPVFRYEFDG